MEAPRFLSALNLPGGKVTQGGRDTSNSPAQSLALLNDPFVLAMADVWAGRLVADGRGWPLSNLSEFLRPMTFGVKRRFTDPPRDTNRSSASSAHDQSFAVPASCRRQSSTDDGRRQGMRQPARTRVENEA